MTDARLRRGLSLLLGFFSSSVPVAALAGEPSAAPAEPGARSTDGGTLSLKRCLELALLHYPRIQEARARAESKRADLDVARYAPYSEFQATAGIGPAPTRRGTNIFSPNSDAALTRTMGVAWQLGFEGAIPLWTFGKLTNTWDAAEANVKAGEHEVMKEKNELRLAVRSAYYGAQAARDGLAIVGEAMQRIDRYLPSLERKVQSGDADEIDLLKLQLSRTELEARGSEARERQEAALAGLGFLTGQGDKVSVVSQALASPKRELGFLPRYLSAARLYRPEVNMVRAGVLAREAQLRLERARFFPDLALGLSAQWSRAPEVTDQRNPYESDRANFLSYGASLVLRYKLDFLPQTARVARAEADLEEIRASERFALGGVGLEVEEAFRQAEDAKRRLDTWTRATALAERWLSQVEQRIQIGTLDEKEVLEPTREYAVKRIARLGAIFDYNMALAKLAQATGWELAAGEE